MLTETRKRNILLASQKSTTTFHYTTPSTNIRLVLMFELVQLPHSDLESDSSSPGPPHIQCRFVFWRCQLCGTSDVSIEKGEQVMSTLKMGGSEGEMHSQTHVRKTSLKFRRGL